MSKEILGVDIGGVIMDRVNDGTDTSFLSENFLRTTTTPHALESLRQLVERRFGGNVFVVSKCGSRTQEKSLRWFDHHRFYEKTLIHPEHVRFCRERHQKGGICAELGVTHFIDDKLEVLSYFTTVGHLYLFQPQEREVRRFAKFLTHVKRVGSWREVLADLVPPP